MDRAHATRETPTEPDPLQGSSNQMQHTCSITPILVLLLGAVPSGDLPTVQKIPARQGPRRWREPRLHGAARSTTTSPEEVTHDRGPQGRVIPQGLYEISMIRDRGRTASRSRCLCPASRSSSCATSSRPSSRSSGARDRRGRRRAGDARRRPARLGDREASPARTNRSKKPREAAQKYDEGPSAPRGGTTSSRPIRTRRRRPSMTPLRPLPRPELEYEEARDAALREGLSPERVRRALSLSTQEKLLENEDGRVRPLPEPARARARGHPRAPGSGRRSSIASSRPSRRYDAERTGLDDPEQLKRLVQTAGVLAFRITVTPRAAAARTPTRKSRASAPGAAREGPAERPVARHPLEPRQRGHAVVHDGAGLRASGESPAAYWNSRGLVGEEYEGEHWILCWDTRGPALTTADGNWSIARSVRDRRPDGRPAIGFEMDPRGARLLGELTSANIGQPHGGAARRGGLHRAEPPRGSPSAASSRAAPRASAPTRSTTSSACSARARSSEAEPGAAEPEHDRARARARQPPNRTQRRVSSRWRVSAFMIFYYFIYGGVACSACCSTRS